MNCGDAGWGWMPGGNWYGVNNAVATSMPGGGSGTTGLPRGPVRAPHVPVHPPSPKDPTMIAVSSKPVPTSGISAASRSFVFQKDSAGMGVPRDGLGRLDKFSHETVTRGMAQTQIYATAPQAGHANGFGSGSGSGSGSSAALSGSIHRGSAPPPSYSSGSMGSWSGGGVNSGGGGGGASMGSSVGRSGGGAPVSTPVASAPVAVHR
jgi:hypothetical protein